VLTGNTSQYIAFSKILEKLPRKDIGLYFDMSILSPFICIRIISKYFRREGNIPVDRDLLNMYVPAWPLPGNGYVTYIRGNQQ
jgi:hypothetical protein